MTARREWKSSRTISGRPRSIDARILAQRKLSSHAGTSRMALWTGPVLVPASAGTQISTIMRFVRRAGFCREGTSASADATIGNSSEVLDGRFGGSDGRDERGGFGLKRVLLRFERLNGGGGGFFPAL